MLMDVIITFNKQIIKKLVVTNFYSNHELSDILSKYLMSLEMYKKSIF